MNIDAEAREIRISEMGFYRASIALWVHYFPWLLERSGSSPIKIRPLTFRFPL